MEKHDEKVAQPVAETELTEAELDATSGGIIIVGGKYAFGRKPINFAELNPQPLPPGPPDPDFKNLSYLGGH